MAPKKKTKRQEAAEAAAAAAAAQGGGGGRAGDGPPPPPDAADLLQQLLGRLPGVAGGGAGGSGSGSGQGSAGSGGNEEVMASIASLGAALRGDMASLRGELAQKKTADEMVNAPVPAYRELQTQVKRIHDATNLGEWVGQAGKGDERCLAIPCRGSHAYRDVLEVSCGLVTRLRGARGVLAGSCMWWRWSTVVPAGKQRSLPAGG